MQRTANLHAGVVDQNFNSTHVGFNFVHCLCHIFGVGHIKNRLADLEAFSLQYGSRRCYFFCIAAIENDMCASFAQGTCKGKADACRGPSDEGQLAVELK